MWWRSQVPENSRCRSGPCGWTGWLPSGAPEVLLCLLEHLEKAARVGRVEPAAGEAQARPELLPWSLRRFRTELLQALAGPLLEVLVGGVAAAVAHQAPVLGEKPGLGEAEEGGQDQPVGQVPSGAEEHEHRRLGHQAVIGHRSSSARGGERTTPGRIGFTQ
jgi:hypothetical protein